MISGRRLGLSKCVHRETFLKVLLKFACRHVRQVQASGKTFQETNKCATCLFGTVDYEILSIF